METKCLLLSLLFALVCSPVLAFTQDASEIASSSSYFQSKVWPILATKCLDCHNDTVAESGLSLKSREGLMRGGARGAAFTSDRPSDSPLLIMVQPDAHPRMPFERPPLSASEIEVLSKWVVAGAPYGVADAGAVKLARWGQRFDKFKASVSELAYAPIATPAEFLISIPFWPIVVGFPLLVLAWCLAGRIKFVPNFLSHPSLLIVCLLIPCGLNLGLLLKHYRASLDPNSSLGMQNQVHMLFGDPPVPVKMHKDTALWRSYYRGNDERSDKLFNNGHYLTCRFDVGIVDSKGVPVVHGSKLIPNETLYFNYTITRGAYTADVLFDSKMMSSVFLTSEPDMHRCREALDTNYLRELELERVWEAQLPLEVKTANDAIERLVYVWQRHYSGEQEYLPKVHYAANVKLVVKDGVVQPGSDLWFNALRVTQPIMNFTIPADQWLSSTPIPELPYPNTEDSELLGIAEHVDKVTR